MKKTTNNLITTALLAGVVLLNSCKKQDIVTDTIDPVTLNSQVQFSTQSYIEAQTIAISAISGNGFTLKNEADNSALSCASITRDFTGARNSMIIDFGAGCVGNNGKTYAGRVLVYYDNDMSQTGNVTNVTFDNFSINGNLVGGTVEFINTGFNTSGNLTGSINVNSNITFEGNASSLSGAFIYTVEKVENVTGISDDNEFYINGSGSGTTSGGFTFNTLVTSPLLRKVGSGCNYFAAGINKTSITGSPDQFLDYGSGTCDNLATLTINGNSQTIELN